MDDHEGTALRYAEHKPAPQLASIVECYWTIEGAGDQTPEPVVPDGRAELIFHPGEPFRRHHTSGIVERQPHAIVAGQITEPIVLSTPALAGVVAVRLRPAAAGGVFGDRADLLTGQLAPLEDVIASSAIAERLAAAASVQARIAVLDAWLLSSAILQPRIEVTKAVETIVASGGTATIGSVTRSTGLSRRQLERLFLENVGLGPKVFARVIRLRRAVKLLRRGESAAGVAAACGYCDQAHMSRDFRQLAGTSPSAWQQYDGALATLFVD